MTVYNGSIPNSLKDTLDDVINDPMKSAESSALINKYCTVEGMGDAHVDELNMGGIGLASEKPQASAYSVGSLDEGEKKRYTARTYAIGIDVTREAQEDVKYNDVIMQGPRLVRAAWKTIDYHGANMFNRGWNALYAGADQQPLFSSVHPLPNGGAESNLLSVSFGPSRIGLQAICTMAETWLGHDGTIEGNSVTHVICPQNQRFAWKGVLGSDKDPDSNSNELNAVRDEDISLVPLKYWTASLTRWAVKTDAEGGMKYKFRRRPMQDSYVDEAKHVFRYAISYRSDCGWTDWRGNAGCDA